MIRGAWLCHSIWKVKNDEICKEIIKVAIKKSWTEVIVTVEYLPWEAAAQGKGWKVLAKCRTLCESGERAGLKGRVGKAGSAKWTESVCRQRDRSWWERQWERYCRRQKAEEGMVKHLVNFFFFFFLQRDKRKISRHECQLECFIVAKCRSPQWHYPQHLGSTKQNTQNKDLYQPAE